MTLNHVAASATLPQIKRIMPVNGSDAGIRYGNWITWPMLGGNDVNFPQIFNWPVVEGSYFTEADERAGATVAVIGHRIR